MGKLKLQIHIYSSSNVRPGVKQDPQVKFLELTNGNVTLEDLSIAVNTHYLKLYKRYGMLRHHILSTPEEPDTDETPEQTVLSTSTKSKTATATTSISPIKSKMSLPTRVSTRKTPSFASLNIPSPAKLPSPPSLGSAAAHGASHGNRASLGR